MARGKAKQPRSKNQDDVGCQRKRQRQQKEPEEDHHDLSSSETESSSTKYNNHHDLSLVPEMTKVRTITEENDMNDSDDDDEEDSIDWETVELPKWTLQSTQHHQEEDEEEDNAQFDEGQQDLEGHHQYKDVHVVFETPRVVLKKSKWEMAYQRQLRDWMHNSHVVLLVGHFLIRNEWCSREDVKSVCLSVIPEHISNQNKRRDRSDTEFNTTIKWLLNWWKDYFSINSYGLMTRPLETFESIPPLDTYSVNLIKNLEQYMDNLGIHDSEIIQDPTAFVNYLAEKSGSRDLSAQLFTSLLRTLGFETRLISSLQPLPYRIPATRTDKPSSSTSTTPSSSSTNISNADNVDDNSTNDSTQSSSRTKQNVKKISAINPTTYDYQNKKAKPPTVWCEIWNPHQKRWICIDPVRQLYDKPQLMEPGISDRKNVLSYVLAFEDISKQQDDQRKGRKRRIRCVVDVTRRYTTHLPKALAARERELTKREKEGGWRLWSELFLFGLQPSELRNKSSTTISASKRRYEEEQIQLEQHQHEQRMPTSMQALRNHPLYVLERHLKKFEVLHPPKNMTMDSMVIGHIKGENVYPRSCVQQIHTRETWIKQGRVVMDDQVPVKRVLSRAVTLEKKRLQEEAKRQGDTLQTDCYGYWQTAPYRPPPVVVGKITKNAYGRVDLFTMDMLPEGAAHIQIDGIGKIARQLGIDYAEAVVDFDFVRGRSIPMVNGIIVAKENEFILLEAWREHEHHQTNKASAKHEKQIYGRWRKLILGAMIDARVNEDYGQPENQTKVDNSTAWDRFLKEREKSEKIMDGGGFILEDDQE
ncbi:uncharacterized protein BX664DRAFT_332731 [Halteromyces radiatus]|uniref:uncharacterized protein n=1 Tax=Halteromyces radiatus TaxID=101107 RepID=UPI002220765A|nr:uncharacterized protein BX664DRAFT_332731 [Halteromyces radiatus]KAI8089323.1 hypothetical protein BX664DRAFT_332731 [Halteromyces radiatus]